jgi:uncharacterized membrane protein
MFDKYRNYNEVDGSVYYHNQKWRIVFVMCLISINAFGFVNLKLTQNILEDRYPDINFNNNLYWQVLLNCLYMIYLIWLLLILIEWDCIIAFLTNKFDDEPFEYYSEAVIYGLLNFIGNVIYYCLIKYDGLNSIKPEAQWDISSVFTNFGGIITIILIPTYYAIILLYQKFGKKERNIYYNPDDYNCQNYGATVLSV